MSKSHSLAEMIEHNGRIAADSSNDLGEWDRTFSTDMAKRYKQYGSRTFLSDKQEKNIGRIFANTGGTSGNTPAPTQDRHGFDNANPDDDIPF